MIGVNQTDVPELDAGIGIRVEGIQAVVLRSDEDDVVLRAVDGQIGNPQRLRVDGAVDRAGEELAESRGIYV